MKWYKDVGFGASVAFVFFMLVIVASATMLNGREFRKTCIAQKGEPVYNGREWVCLKN